MQVIPTSYHGVQFRSMLEARWAEWFDDDGIPWKYEPTRIPITGGHNYTPDFAIMLDEQTVLVEIKPTTAHAEHDQRPRALSLDIENAVLCIAGYPCEWPFAPPAFAMVWLNGKDWAGGWTRIGYGGISLEAVVADARDLENLVARLDARRKR